MNRLLYIYFHKFLKPSYDFHGLTLRPNFLPNEGLIRWSVENPQDKSYFMEILISFTEELFITFCQLLEGEIGSGFYRNNSRYACSFEQTNKYYYINKSDDQKLLNSIKQITKIDYKNIFYSDVECTYVNIYPAEDFTITIGMKLLNPHNEQHSKLINTELSEAIFELIEDDFFYSDYLFDLFHPVINVITNLPLLYDHTWMFFTTSVDFRNKNNVKIK